MVSVDNNLKSLYIDGKPVRKASLGGKVFFEKHDYELTVSASKPIIQIGEETTITATLTDYNKSVSGETVVFSSEDAVETNELNSSGTYDFGDIFSMNLIDSSNFNEVIIGQSTNVINISKYPSNFVIRVNNSNYYWDTDYPIEYVNGVLKFRDFNRSYSINVSSVDMTTWEINNSQISVESYFYKTGVTDSNGECSVGYVGKGAGDLNIKVDCMNLQETYNVQDCNLYDVASSSGLSHYSTPIPLQSNTSDCLIEYDSTMEAYKVTDKSSSIKGIPFNLNNLPSSLKIECDVYVRTGSANSVIGIFGGTASNGFDYLLTNFTNWLFAKNIFTGSTQSIRLSETNKTGQWVHLTVENNNGTVTATFSQNDTAIVTDTITTSNISQYGIATGWGNGYYSWIKNIKVKPL